jgi:hypothetical protein
MDLAVFPEVALIIFAGVFLAVAARTFRRGAQLQDHSDLPLREAAPVGGKERTR